MRILVVTDLFPPVAFGGYEAECAVLVEHLRAGHEVTVLTTDLRRDTVETRPDVRRELDYAGGRIRASLEAPRFVVRAARTTREVLADVGPDLVYISNGAALPQAALVVAATAGVPVVIRFSERWFAQEFLRGDRYLRHLLGGRAGLRGMLDRAVSVVDRHPALGLRRSLPISASLSWASGALRRDAGIPDTVEPVLDRVIHPGTPKHGPLRSLTRRPPAAPVVLYLGRVTTAKGAEVAVDAVADLRRRHGTLARLEIVGPSDAPMQRQLEERADAAGIRDAIRFAGAVDADGVADALATASVLVLPSVVHEAFPLVALEAALARLPVVASRLGGIPEGLSHEEHALLFEPGDADACADALHRVLTDAPGTSARVRRAFERASTFSLDRYLEEAERLLVDAVDAFRDR